MENVALEIKNVSKTFKNNTVVKSISFNVNKGEIVGFLGPNGAGKTTTIRIITGLMKPDSGEVLIYNKSILSDYEKAIKHIGAVVETPHLYEYMTGSDNLHYFSMARGNISKEIIDPLIELSGLKNSLNKKVKNYSLGMKQRLSLIVALLHNPDLIILDEPTNGLDPAGTKELREFLKNLAHKHGKSILISSHILTEMQLICDKVVIISNGEIKCTKSISELQNQGSLENLFIEKTKGGNF